MRVNRTDVGFLALRVLLDFSLLFWANSFFLRTSLLRCSADRNYARCRCRANPKIFPRTSEFRRSIFVQSVSRVSSGSLFWLARAQRSAEARGEARGQAPGRAEPGIDALLFMMWARGKAACRQWGRAAEVRDKRSSSLLSLSPVWTGQHNSDGGFGGSGIKTATGKSKTTPPQTTALFVTSWQEILEK